MIEQEEESASSSKTPTTSFTPCLPRQRRYRRLTHTPSIVTHKSTLLTNIDLERIGRDHQPLEKELRRSVSDQAIALHLSESKSSIARTSFGGLTGQDGARSPVSV